MPVYFLIYVSRAEGDLSEQQLLEILAKSRSNNERDGLTGMLLYKDQRFMQVLEGEKEKVLATYRRISEDPRHRDVVVLLRGELPERDFPDWSMGFKSIDNETAKTISGFTPFLDMTFSVFDFASDPSRAHKLLRIFRRM